MGSPKTPDEVYAELFEQVQTGRIFSDSKTFVDAVPRGEPAVILQRFREQRDQRTFDLGAFVAENFVLPETAEPSPPTAVAHSVRERIESLWGALTRADAPTRAHSSRIELPHPYLVPGGRFRELYYWDSYFSMLGLAESGEVQLVQAMVDDFAFLIDRLGFVPNGARSYFCTRSQPPFFVMMVELLAEITRDPGVCRTYLPQLKREYAFWMAGSDALCEQRPAERRVAAIGDALLNRYWDDSDRPRQESHAEDLDLAARTNRAPTDVHREVRAACESGWDFSSRWFADGRSIETIQTSRILPIDLNVILHRLETALGQICESCGETREAEHYRGRAEKRKALIQSIFFDPREGFFIDLTLPDRHSTGVLSLAGAYPLFFGIASDEQAAQVAERLQRDFLKPGGWVTTLAHTGQQWDAPNGWAPLQWIVYAGLDRYGFRAAAQSGAHRWIDNNLGSYRDSGRLFEKYDVERPGLAAAGGEYDVQEGFGWTNAVLLKLMRLTDREPPA